MLSKEILKSKLKLLKPDQIFDEDKINKDMTLDQFKKIRVNSYIPIEDIITMRGVDYD